MSECDPDGKTNPDPKPPPRGNTSNHLPWQKIFGALTLGEKQSEKQSLQGLKVPKKDASLETVTDSRSDGKSGGNMEKVLGSEEGKEVVESVASHAMEPEQTEPPKPAKPWLFKPGQSGNPAGRPRFETGKVKVDRRRQFREMFAESGGELIQKAIQTALSGDQKMLMELLKYVTPQARSQQEAVDLGLPEDATASERLQAVQIAATNGTISADTATMISRSIKDAIESEKVLQALSEMRDLDDRIKRLSKSGNRV